MATTVPHNFVAGYDAGQKKLRADHLDENFEALAQAIDSKQDTLPVASASVLGGVKIGKNLTISADGTLDANSGDPIGSLKEFAHDNIDEGYLVCNGAAVGRATYPLLFAKIGTTWGAGDGSTTFNLPNFVGRFLEGGASAGGYKEAGLPNITGSLDSDVNGSGWLMFNYNSSGAILPSSFTQPNSAQVTSTGQTKEGRGSGIVMDASRSSPIYGRSNTVQPASATVVICIKAFEAVVETEDITTSHLLQEILALKAKRIGVVDWHADGETPENCLLCDGRAVSRTEYAALFAKIGTKYGAGDGSTTFNLPPLIGRYAQGVVPGEAGKVIEAGLPNITGLADIVGYPNQNIIGSSITTGPNPLPSTTNGWIGENPENASITKLSVDASRSSNVYGRSSTVTPPSIGLVPWINY